MFSMLALQLGWIKTYFYVTGMVQIAGHVSGEGGVDYVTFVAIFAIQADM